MGLGYAFGATTFPAAGVGAPQIRDHIYWMADTALGEGWGTGESIEGRTGQDRERRTNDSVYRSWRKPDWVVCPDGRIRPVEPELKPLAYGIPARVDLLRGYGNAVCVPAAREFLAFQPIFTFRPT